MSNIVHLPPKQDDDDDWKERIDDFNDLVTELVMDHPEVTNEELLAVFVCHIGSILRNSHCEKCASMAAVSVIQRISDAALKRKAS